MKTKRSVIIVDNDPTCLNAIYQELLAAAYTVHDRCVSGDALMLSLKNNRPDLVILEEDLPAVSGSRLCACVKDCYPEIRTLVYTRIQDPRCLQKILGSKADGLGLKKNPSDLLHCMEQLQRNGCHTDRAVELLLHQAKSKRRVLAHNTVEILDLLVNGMSSKEIAHHLNLSERSVPTYLKRIKESVGAKNQAELVAMAIKHGWADHQELMLAS